MMTYLLSFAAGILVGVVYCLIGVRSPAPPYIALIGLLGILIGEQVFPIVKNKFVTPAPTQKEAEIKKNN